MDAGILAVVWFVAGMVLGGLGIYVASQKGRPAGEGFILGFLFGPLGVLVAALLPTIPEPEFEDVEPADPPMPSGWVPTPPSRPGPKPDDLDELAAFDAITRDAPKPKPPRR